MRWIALISLFLFLSDTFNAGEATIPVQGVLEVAIPHGTASELGSGSVVGLTVVVDGVVVDQTLVPTLVQWSEHLHGFRITVPPTPLLLPARSQLLVGWALNVTCNGKGPWQGGRMSRVTLARQGNDLVLGGAQGLVKIAEAKPERPSVFDPLPVRPGKLVLKLDGGPVSCQVLAAKTSATKPGLIIALGMGAGDAASCGYGLSMWWTGAPRAGWTVAAPAVRGDTRWADVPAAVSGAVIDALVTQLNCDPQRVVVAGPSNGGSAALTWMRDNPDRIRAALAFPGMLPAAPGSLAGKPVWLRWGGKDDNGWRSGAGQTAGWLTAAGAVVDRAEMPGAGHIPPITGPEMLAWLTSHVP